MLTEQNLKIIKAVGAILIVLVVVPVLTLGTALVSVLYAFPVEIGEPIREPTDESRITRIVDSTGRELGVLRKFETSIPVTEADIPEVLKQAVVAAEDQRFYSHRGYDPIGVLRAAWADVRGRTVVQGGSTITQQYIKNNYTGGERTISRKVREVLLANSFDRKEDKDAILFLYLQDIYLGGGAYGVGAAAETYFKKSVKDLTLSEAALLAGVIPAPSEFEPRTNPVRAETNRRRVLDQMLDQDRITSAQHAEATSQALFLLSAERPEAPGPATVVHPQELNTSSEPYYFDMVRRYLEARYPLDVVYRGGLRVEAALDPRLQQLAEDKVAEALKGTNAPLEMALATVEPTTGFIKAIVGGRDFARSSVNLALGACPEGRPVPAADAPVCLAGGGTGRQPGSAFKAFTLAKAFERGIGPNRVYSGPGEFRFPDCRGEGCVVRNVESGSFGSITLRSATHNSVNTVYAQLVRDVGVKETAELAHRLGVTMVSPDGIQANGEPYGPSLTLGAAETSPLDMAAAYSVFAARGLQQPATPVVRITDSAGKVIEDNTVRKPKRILTEAVADNVTDVLKGVVTSGTGRNADIGRPDGTAGKTGSSERNADAWFVGYTPVLSTAIWMGFSDSNTRSLRNIRGVPTVFGGTIPASTWGSFMGAALENAPPADFAPITPLPTDLNPGPRRMPADPRSPTADNIMIPPPPPETFFGSPGGPPTTAPGFFIPLPLLDQLRPRPTTTTTLPPPPPDPGSEPNFFDPGPP
ncbi:MAG: transglycosylase domain-containing protein [Acidimicrobiales bacterium]